MRRYEGEPLAAAARIAIVANDALGNYVVSTPLVQMLRARYPKGTLHYFGGIRTEELWAKESMIDFGWPLFGARPACTMRKVCEVVPKGYDLVVNVEASEWARCFTAAVSAEAGFVVGPCLGEDGRGSLPFADDERGRLAADRDWTAPDLTRVYPFLDSGFIGEIFCRLAYLDGPVPGYRLPSSPPPFDPPPCLLATAASLPEKLWTYEGWRAVCEAMAKRFGVAPGLLGAAPSSQRHFWRGSELEERLVSEGLVQDLRGKLSLPEVVGAIERTQLVVSLDNGILHLAAGTKTPVTGLYRNGIHRLWAPPAKNVHVVLPGEGGRVSEIRPETVLEVAERG